MKRTFKSLLGVVLAVIMVVSLMAVPSSAAAKISSTSFTLTKGYQTTLKVTGASGTVTWSTGDKSVATVSKGKVVGRGLGSTYIYAKVGGTTLKSKVTVVPSKITANKSSVELDSAGDTAIVTMTIKGSHSGLTVGTTNKKVASASWVKPVEWDGDKIKIKITAKGKGTGRIKVYLKNYASTCYKYIDVTVGDSLYEDDDPDSTSTMNIIPYSNKVEVNAGGSTTLQVYSSNQSNMGYSSSNTSVATVSAGTASGNYRTFTINGIKSGTTTIRFYDKKNTKKYVDVTVTVGASLKYYELYTVKPTSALLSTDKVLEIKVNNTTYYMLVPENYDPAYSNTLTAQKTGKYSYYTVFDREPGRYNTGDRYYPFTHTNSKYTYGTRYILIPANYDEVRLNTVMAEYNGSYEYYTVYNKEPVKQTSWDYIETWYIPCSNGAYEMRYLLVPYDYDSDRVNAIREKDMTENSAYTYYTPYSSYPTVKNNSDVVVSYTKNGKWRYMVVPKTGSDVVIRRNDAIQKDTGTYEPYVMYTTEPTANTTKGEYVKSTWYGNQYYYVLCNDPENTEAFKSNWAKISTNAPRGT